MSRKCHVWTLIVGCGVPLVCKYLVLVMVHMFVMEVPAPTLDIVGHDPRVGWMENIRPQLLPFSSPFNQKNASHTLTVNCGVCGVKWTLSSPLGNTDISHFKLRKPILCYENSPSFQNLSEFSTSNCVA